jgi:hypothetical protein
MKFRILPKVSGVRLKGMRYAPGDVVDLPESYLGETYLEPVPEPSPTPIPVEEKSVASDMGMLQEKAAEPTPEKPRQRRSKKDA